MRIIIVAGDLFVGGSQRYLSTMANYWNSIGIEVFMILLRPGETHYKLDEGISLTKLHYDHKDKRKLIFRSARTYIELRRKLKEVKPDVVLSNLSTTNILTILASHHLHHKLFIRDAYGHTRKRSKLERKLRKKLYPKVDGIIAQTKEIKDFTIKEIGQQNIKVIRNPVRHISDDGTEPREKIILNMGELTGRKGQVHIIDICEKLNDPDWKFIILGEGRKRAVLERMITERHLNDRISLFGAVKNVDDWLLRSSIFIFPSLLEGLPNALIEAMSAGLPCVSFDCDDGPRDLINDGENGFLVPVGDADMMLKRIKQLIESEDLRKRLGNKAIKSVEHFSVQNISKEVLDFFNVSN